MANKGLLDLPAAAALTGAEVVPIDQGGATSKTTVAAIAAKAPIQDHNALTNLTVGDVHTQYLNQARGDLRYAPLGRTITAGNGLTGGGTLSADRTLTVQAAANGALSVSAGGIALDILSVGVLPEAVDGTNDKVPIYNTSESRVRYVSPSVLLSGASGFVTNARAVNSGAGLTGGGDLSADRTLAVGAGTGITVNADDVALDTAHARNVDHSAVSITAGTGLTGGGTITASRTINLDTTNTRNVDHAAVSIIAGTGLTGGGDLSASRTLNLDTTAIAILAGANVFTNSPNEFGKNGVNGYLDLRAGIGAGKTGFIEFYQSTGTRAGFLGGTSSPLLVLEAENGWSWDLFSFSGATVPWAKVTGAPAGFTESSGTFTGTLTGMNSTVQGTMTWRKTGSKASVFINSGLAGTSNATDMALLGLPAAVTPSVAVRVPVMLNDNSGLIVGSVFINTLGQVIFSAANGNTNGFSASGVKGFPSGFQMIFDLGA